MPAMRFRSRTLRRVFVKMPGGSTVRTYRKRRNAAAQCAVTGETLHGVPRGNKTEVRALPKSQRRPSRPYGGVLSSRAMRRKLIQKARLNSI